MENDTAMPDDPFGSLEDVELREAWRHEATDFTPWLRDNLARLGDAIGVVLEPKGSEVAVGEYSADILALDALNESNVLIENQLERSDHTHLGQILTYMAGLQARTVIWIAQGFKEPHLAAIKLLNEITSEDYAFFAVVVRAVRIADSPIAPLFEVVEKPNHWERRTRSAARTAGSQSRAEDMRVNRKFWTHYSARHPDDGVRAEYGGYNFRISVAKDKPSISLMRARARASVGIFFTSAGSEMSNEQVIDWLAQRTNVIRSVLGIDIDRIQWCFQETPCDTTDPATWDDAADWLHERLHEYRRVFDQD